VSLNQAIEIHARVLAHRFGDRAPLHAQEKAHHCSASGDDEGHAVWLRVAAVAEMLLKEESRQQQPGTTHSDHSGHGPTDAFECNFTKQSE
jgi:hypothetical protein